jgi:hypothetical protein
MLTQRTPFEALTYPERLQHYDELPPDGPRRFNRKVSRALDALVLRALHPDPDERFRDGEEMGEALRTCSTQPSLLPGVPLPRLSRIRRNPFPLLATIGFGLAFLLGALYLHEHESHRRLTAHFQTERMMMSRALLEDTLGDHQALLRACLRLDPLPQTPLHESLLNARVHMADGRVVRVELASQPDSIGPRAKRCIANVIEQLDLHSLGLISTMTVAVSLRLPAPPPIED